MHSLNITHNVYFRFRSGGVFVVVKERLPLVASQPTAVEA